VDIRSDTEFSFEKLLLRRLLEVSCIRGTGDFLTLVLRQYGLAGTWKDSVRIPTADTHTGWVSDTTSMENTKAIHMNIPS
jgi:hypothetical protein